MATVVVVLVGDGRVVVVVVTIAVAVATAVVEDGGAHCIVAVATKVVRGWPRSCHTHYLQIKSELSHIVAT